MAGFMKSSKTIQIVMKQRHTNQTFSNCECSQTLTMWHDHATILLKRGVIMVTVAVFFSDKEMNILQQAICIQSEVQQPEIYQMSSRPLHSAEN